MERVGTEKMEQENLASESRKSSYRSVRTESDHVMNVCASRQKFCYWGARRGTGSRIIRQP